RICAPWLSNSLLSFSAALLFLLSWFGGLVVGELSEDFFQCLDFFYKETPPSGFDYRAFQPICQRYKNTYRFASLYHRQHRAPLFSAYILRIADGKRPNISWMYEPQVGKISTTVIKIQPSLIERPY
uniref:Uncharacterized protein n=1 Tax=Fundulus heteroclitus TaxID=8078 RepID=A0A3Q2QXW9_FUNHE